MLSRSSVSEPAYLGMVTVVAFTIAVIVAGEINHLNHLLWRGQDLPHGGEVVVVVVVVVVRIKDFSVIPELGRASSWEWLADSWWRLKATATRRGRHVQGSANAVILTTSATIPATTSSRRYGRSLASARRMLLASQTTLLTR